MIYINHNSALEQLQELVDNSFNKTQDYLPSTLKREQEHALELLKKRIYLEEIIDESISFNRALQFEETNPHVKLISSAEELIKIFKLRSEVYLDSGFQHKYPDTIEGLNFDKYDKNSAILYYESNNHMTGTFRFIFDSQEKLPTESVFSFEDVRQQYGKFGELSRFIIKNDTKGLSQEFKYMTQSIYNLFLANGIEITVVAIIQEHYKYYTKFGGSEIISSIENFDNLGYPVYIMSWNPHQASKFFKKAFLS